MILSGELNFYERFLKLKTLKVHTKEHYKILFGEKLGEEKFNSRATNLSKKISYASIEEKLHSFFNLKLIKKHITRDQLTDEQLSELTELIESQNWKKFHDKHALMLDLILFHSPGYVQRFSICESFKNKIFSTEYLNARYGGSVQKIKEIRQEKIEQAKNNFQNVPSYWTSRGYSEQEAVEKTQKIQSNRASRAGAKIKANFELNHRKIEYWINKGFSIEEAKKKLSASQTRSKKYFLEKYGDSLGERKFQDMLQKRKDTWLERPESERESINSSKGRTFDQLCEQFGQDNAISIIKNRTSNNSFVSKESKEFFRDLDFLLGDLSKNSVTGYKSKERWIKTNFGINFVDYFLNGIVVEYYGSFWHADHRIFLENTVHPVIRKTIEEIRNNDKNRITELEKLGHTVIIVWSFDVNLNRDDELNRVKNLIIKELKNDC
jgi:hypothetical protein